MLILAITSILVGYLLISSFTTSDLLHSTGYIASGNSKSGPAFSPSTTSHDYQEAFNETLHAPKVDGHWHDAVAYWKAKLEKLNPFKASNATLPHASHPSHDSEYAAHGPIGGAHHTTNSSHSPIALHPTSNGSFTDSSSMSGVEAGALRQEVTEYAALVEEWLSSYGAFAGPSVVDKVEWKMQKAVETEMNGADVKELRGVLEALKLVGPD